MHANNARSCEQVMLCIESDNVEFADECLEVNLQDHVPDHHFAI